MTYTAMKLKNKSLIFRMTLLALCVALFVGLNFISIDLKFIKISVKALPIIFIAVLYGPIEGALVGGLGELICQLFSPYGLTVTTPLWILPFIVQGLIVGFMMKQKNPKDHIVLWVITVIVSCLTVTGINTFSIWLDAKIFEYPSQLTFISIILRFVGSIISSVVYGLIVPLVLFEPLIKLGKIEIAEE